MYKDFIKNKGIKKNILESGHSSVNSKNLAGDLVVDEHELVNKF